MSSDLKYRPPVAVDFDGTLFGENCVGAVEFLRELNKKYFVVIFSSRANSTSGLKFIHDWIRENKLAGIVKEVTTKKHLNFVAIIDNRAIRCDGTNYKQVLEELGV